MALAFVALSLIVLFFQCEFFIIELKAFRLDKDLLIADKAALMKSIPVDIPSMILCFGTPNNQCLNLIPSTVTYFIITQHQFSESHYYFNIYNRSQSSTFTSPKYTLGFPSHNDFYKGQLAKDYITIPQLKKNPNDTMLFFQIQSQNDQKEPLPIDGYLGLQMLYDFNNVFNLINTSYVDFLFNTSQIYMKTFALNINETGGGLIQFGEEITDDGSQCKTDVTGVNKINWNCNARSIKIANSIFVLGNTTIIFNSLSGKIYVNKNIGTFLFDQYIINRYYEKCYKQQEYTYTTVICTKDIDIDALDDITLRIINKDDSDAIDMVIKWKNVFKLITHYEREVYISLLMIEEKMAQGVISLGLPGFINHTISFDVTNKLIGISNKALKVDSSLLHDLRAKDNNNSSNMYLVYLYTSVIINLIIGIGVSMVALNKLQLKY